ncbi:hypothetical protein MRB53_026268 [Persea americana]|uniref:Uncharacterized protein n=1 Tax=Persea americana TaxID=3435 RepID=A0ACC2LHR0_PERAE|nr:hypothetical protein MRB53_026268 [Persea americana]
MGEALVGSQASISRINVTLVKMVNEASADIPDWETYEQSTLNEISLTCLPPIKFGFGAVGYLTVTAVDSGSKALEFLGIHDEQGTSPSGSSESQVLKA